MQQSGLGHRWPWLLALAVLACGSYGLYEMKEQNSKIIPPVKSMAPSHARPHAVAMVRQGDLPISVQAMGTVTASHTVTVKAEVDGQLTNIRFQEGHFVRKDQVLATIDPRP